MGPDRGWSRTIFSRYLRWAAAPGPAGGGALTELGDF